MKRNVPLFLLIINSILFILSILPIGFGIMINVSRHVGSIGIIGGSDGPTAIFVSDINILPVFLVIFEIILTLWFFKSRSRK